MGPFIIEEFIHGQRLKQILSGPNDGRVISPERTTSWTTRKSRSSTDSLLKFMLQLFKLNFRQIGSLVVGSSRLQPPLTLTANEITRLSGVVNILGIALPSPLFCLVLF